MGAFVACVTAIVLLLLVLFAWNNAPVRPWTSAKDSTTLSTTTTDDVKPQNRTRGEAYVALFYNGFFPTMRVLGQSLRVSGTTRDYIALCLNSPEWAKRILKSDGWIIKSINPLPKKCVGDVVYSRHFAKIQAWLLTEYRKIISIDSDAIVLRNIDHLFKCGEFCAAYRHSDLFNTGVVVLKPSLKTFQDICKNIQRIGSYTSGDQGFLNYYYEDLKKAPMFSKDINTVTTNDKFLRLPAEYNGDVSVFYLANKWMYIDVEEPYVIHYTLGPIKPWKWWSYPLFSLNWRWKKLRDELPATDIVEPSLWHVSSWLPILLLTALYPMSRMCCGLYTRLFYRPLILKGTKFIGVAGGKVDKIFSPLLLAVALYLAYPYVPLDMSPLEAWTRFEFWVLLFFVTPFSAYCHLVYYLGRQEATDHGKVVSTHRIVAESMFWLVLTTLVYYLEFLIPSVLLSMKHRVITFISLGVLNLILCYFFGLRLISLSYHYSRGNFL